MEIGQILMSLLAILVGAVTYFLKATHKSIDDHKTNYERFKVVTSEEIGRLKGKIELVEQENKLKYQQIQETTQLEIKNLADQIHQLTVQIQKIIDSKIK